MPLTQFHSGTKLTFTGTFSIGGSLTDPGAATIKLRDPKGVITSKAWPADAEVNKTATGTFVFENTPVTEGVWRFRWEGTSPVAIADEGVFEIIESPFVTS